MKKTQDEEIIDTIGYIDITEITIARSPLSISIDNLPRYSLDSSVK